MDSRPMHHQRINRHASRITDHSFHVCRYQRTLRRRLHVTVSTLTFLIFDDSFKQISAPEVGPKHIGDINLAVSNLPQQEIRDAHLTARPDQQVRIGKVLCEEAPLDVVLGYPGGVSAHSKALDCDLAACFDDFGTAAVVQGNREYHSAI